LDDAGDERHRAAAEGVAVAQVQYAAAQRGAAGERVGIRQVQYAGAGNGDAARARDVAVQVGDRAAGGGDDPFGRSKREGAADDVIGTDVGAADAERGGGRQSAAAQGEREAAFADGAAGEQESVDRLVAADRLDAG